MSNLRWKKVQNFLEAHHFSAVNAAKISWWGLSRTYPLHVASKEGNFEVMLLLMKYGADPKQRDGRGKTAIAYTQLALRKWNSVGALCDAYHCAPGTVTSDLLCVGCVMSMNNSINSCWGWWLSPVAPEQSRSLFLLRCLLWELSGLFKFSFMLPLKKCCKGVLTITMLRFCSGVRDCQLMVLVPGCPAKVLIWSHRWRAWIDIMCLHY